MHCLWCGRYQKAHTVDNCTYFKAALVNGRMRAIKLQAKIQSGGRRVCGYCASLEHASTRCSKRFEDKRANLMATRQAVDEAFVWLYEIGFGPGAMISGMANERMWSGRGKGEKVVVIEDFTPYVLSHFVDELINGNQRNWYKVNAVDTSNERVQRIYLPYHITYAPKPTSKNVSIVHKADPAEIDKMKNSLSCYKNPIVNFNTAEEFFNAGYKFKAGSDEVVAPA